MIAIDRAHAVPCRHCGQRVEKITGDVCEDCYAYHAWRYSGHSQRCKIERVEARESDYAVPTDGCCYF